jgi:hypothetical protein
MWTYYGSKGKLAQHYPTPKHDLIIEPFAGAAKYSLRYWEKEVMLVDKYDVVIKIWKWLQQCSPNDILGLPRLKVGDDIRTMNLSEEEFLFLSFATQGGTPIPVYTTSAYGENSARPMYDKVASNLHKIKHWKIIHGSYEDIDNKEATWFIDPPYQFGGHRYKHSSKSLDFDYLGEWCKSRQGQVIVCENTKATWLPFKPVVKNTGQVHDTTEAIWSNVVTAFDNEQLTLF